MEAERKIITFWCQKCRIDWKVVAERHVKNSVLGYCWIARCDECGKQMVRLINDAANDPYYRRSKKTRGDVRKYEKDLIQPNDPRFDILYPEHRRERERKQAEADKKAWEAKNK